MARKETLKGPYGTAACGGQLYLPLHAGTPPNAPQLFPPLPPQPPLRQLPFHPTVPPVPAAPGSRERVVQVRYVGMHVWLLGGLQLLQLRIEGLRFDSSFNPNI